MYDLKELVAVIEEEVHIGEDLLANLSAQREAIRSWSSSALLVQVQEKEHLLLQLSVLEEKRRSLIAHSSCFSTDIRLPLKEFLISLPVSPETTALSQLQPRAWAVYSRLRAEESRLVSLLENLLSHMQEMLHPLSRSSVHLYGKSGAPFLSRPESGLIRGKA